VKADTANNMAMNAVFLGVLRLITIIQLKMEKVRYINFNYVCSMILLKFSQLSLYTFYIFLACSEARKRTVP
jgi:hypothetical protein